MYPAQDNDNDTNENSSEDDEEDFEASIAKELNELKAPQKTKRVSSIHTDVECRTYYIHTHIPHRTCITP